MADISDGMFGMRPMVLAGPARFLVLTRCAPGKRGGTSTLLDTDIRFYHLAMVKRL